VKKEFQRKSRLAGWHCCFVELLFRVPNWAGAPAIQRHSKQILPLYLKIGNDCFRPRHFQLIVKTVNTRGCKMLSLTEEYHQVIWYLRP